jgi:hypothetical protein
MTNRLKINRAQILAYRRGAQALDDRLPPGADSPARHPLVEVRAE